MNTKSILRSGALAAAVAGALISSGCGGSAGESPANSKALSVALVDGQFTEPALVDGTCVIFAPVLTAEQLRQYTTPTVYQTFRHIGASIRQCLGGEAKTYIADIPAHYFSDTVFYTYDGTCPAGSRSCFYYTTSNAVIDDAQAYDERFARTQDNEDALMGHETYHAVAGNFHD